jgi:heat shock protein beta
MKRTIVKALFLGIFAASFYTGCLSSDATPVDASKKVRAGSQEYTFQAEVNRLMDILVNSLYSNKDVFLRELISNACDAMDKIRFLSLTDKNVLGEGDTAKLEIRISLDKENNMLYIQDRGIGMTKDDLIKNLGTIAKSGTSAFLEQAQKGGDVNLIGQFGVGFYSVYLVSDWVEVVSKHNDDKQYIWSSSADGSFTIVEDSENEPLGRGTLIKIHLKPEALEYIEESKLKELVTRYSEFMNFPIYIQTLKEVDVPVEDDNEDEDSEEDKADGDVDEDGVDDDEDDSSDSEDKKAETRKEKQLVWDLVNDNKAIWLRKPGDVTKEEYDKFYKAVSKNFDEPLTFSHFKAEGDVEFKAVLFIPTTAPFDFYDKYYDRRSTPSIKLYVRRVFISDDVAELLPKYLSFVRGIVDSDTLPLQVSREQLQQHDSLKTIKKKLVRKLLDIIKKMADDELKCKEQDESDKELEERDQVSDDDCKKFATFWKQFGRAIKLGIIEDTTNRNRLAKLLRFKTSKSGDELISLDDYISNMKEGQKEIYFLGGQSEKEIASSPYVERLLKKDYEVIYFTDVLDEYVMQHMTEYDDKKFSDASKDELKMRDQDEKESKRDKALKDEFKDFTKWWKKTVGEDKIANVKVSSRLLTTPCIVVAGKYGQSANMERITKAQAFQDPSRASFMRSQRVLEINPRHPLIKGLKDKVTVDEADPTSVSLAKLIFETAMIESGFQVEDTKSFSDRVYELAKDGLGLTGSLKDIEEDAADSEEMAEDADEDSAEAKEEL